MGALTVHHDVVTTGGEGTSLVKGVQVTLKAVAFSVKPGGTIESVTIGGALRTEGAGVVTLEVTKGASIAATALGKGIEARAAGSSPTDIQGNVPPLDGMTLTGG